MNWQKRECPIKMGITPYGSGWEDIDLEIQGEHHWWSVSGCLGTVLRNLDGIALTLDAIHARLDEDAITLRLGSTIVGSTNGSNEVAVVGHHKIISVSDASQRVGRLSLNRENQENQD